jgi:glycogen operon protein
MDYIACGYPDMSYHGTTAWYPDFSNYSRVLGILIAGDYSVAYPDSSMVAGPNKYKKVKKDKDDYFYFAFNMHWEKHEFELPKLPNGKKWKVIIDTSKEDDIDKLADKTLVVDERCIVVLQSTNDIEDVNNKKGVIKKTKEIQ